MIPKIRALQSADIPLLKDFAPPEWNTDLAMVFAFHFGQPYFYPILAEVNGEVIGCANALCQGNTGWLGNIIVSPAFRGRGIGQALTGHLVKFFHMKDISHQVLIATQLGEPVYRKLGFEVRSYYCFLKRERTVEEKAISGVRLLERKDAEAVFAIDRQVTGEQRQPFLNRFLENAWVHTSPSGRVDGFFLPKLANGLVIAESDPAGLALLRWRISLGAQTCVVPEGSRAAIELLGSIGFVETARAPRMSLGPDTDWQSEHVYSRGSGFCG